MLGLDGLWIDRRPNVARWFDRLRARPSFEDALVRAMTDADRQRLTVSRDETWPRSGSGSGSGSGDPGWRGHLTAPRRRAKCLDWWKQRGSGGSGVSHVVQRTAFTSERALLPVVRRRSSAQGMTLHAEGAGAHAGERGAPWWKQRCAGRKRCSPRRPMHCFHPGAALLPVVRRRSCARGMTCHAEGATAQASERGAPRWKQRCAGRKQCSPRRPTHCFQPGAALLPVVRRRSSARA
jgi:hypothetical protein